MKNIKRKAAFVLSLVLLIGNVGITQVDAATIGQVGVERPLAGTVMLDGGTLNVRQSPSLKANVVASLNNGDYIMVVGEAEEQLGAENTVEFYRIQYDKNGNFGYVAKEFVYLHTEFSCYLRANIDNGTLNMREGAGAQYNSNASIPINTAFAYLSDDDDHSGWYYGVYGNVAGYTINTYTKICYFH